MTAPVVKEPTEIHVTAYRVLQVNRLSSVENGIPDAILLPSTPSNPLNLDTDQLGTCNSGNVAPGINAIAAREVEIANLREYKTSGENLQWTLADQVIVSDTSVKYTMVQIVYPAIGVLSGMPHRDPAVRKPTSFVYPNCHCGLYKRHSGMYSTRNATGISTGASSKENLHTMSSSMDTTADHYNTLTANDNEEQQGDTRLGSLPSHDSPHDRQRKRRLYDADGPGNSRSNIKMEGLHKRNSDAVGTINKPTAGGLAYTLGIKSEAVADGGDYILPAGRDLEAEPSDQGSVKNEGIFCDYKN
ncbi:hypothetical protein H072_3163 [Dactylellina haptotyla CBS 200.50]|uniref:Uncharacterized protein n=1 Tax=Dactylellina haptotyla (strain CBS 200.50) TaxID=1284197 RepID=S8AJ52_DACHA|nr:hypothetical protein H072_3163 [Dactylellina haptotyla CBS 200.50]